MRPLLLASVAVLCLIASGRAQVPAQTTWHNLTFGSTRDEVQRQLAAQGMETQHSLNGTLSATHDYELVLPGLDYPIPLLPRFHFSADDHLEDVTLPVDLAGMRREWNGLLGGDLTTLLFAQEHLAGALAGRYGTPIYTSPSCDTVPKDATPNCVIFWNGPGQTIRLERSGPLLFIRYQMLATDL